MKSVVPVLFVAAFALSTPLAIQAQSVSLQNFADGPLISGFGQHAAVSGSELSAKTYFKVAFDVAAQGKPGEINRKFDSLARFLNMHVAAGIPKENIQLALVVHGKAGIDLLDHKTFQKAFQQNNANKLLLEELMANNVQVILCGQSAAAYEINHSQLIEGVEIELSAMTAHALLQQQGYTVNPF